ncbi:hypothetical protein C8J57DRAFT_1237046 [Mycena rebaudengoi]|nr:hypothetical protein C8J57DRAFT_1237046 [Mycena rebaudengoi]
MAELKGCYGPPALVLGPQTVRIRQWEASSRIENEGRCWRRRIDKAYICRGSGMRGEDGGGHWVAIKRRSQSGGTDMEGKWCYAPQANSAVAMCVRSRVGVMGNAWRAYVPPTREMPSMMAGRQTIEPQKRGRGLAPQMRGEVKLAAGTQINRIEKRGRTDSRNLVNSTVKFFNIVGKPSTKGALISSPHYQPINYHITSYHIISTSQKEEIGTK